MKLILALLLVPSCLASTYGQTTLSDITIFDTDTSGEISGINRWDTTGGNDRFNLYAALFDLNGALINSGDGVDVSPNLTLTPGNYDVFLFGSPGVDTSNIGINLFFDGNAVPGISAFSEMTSLTNPNPAFAVNNASETFGTSNNFVPASGSLDYDSGNTIVELTAFSWATPTVDSIDRISRFSESSDGTNDYVGRFSVSVTSVPEPNSFAVLGTTILGALARRRRNCQRTV